MPGPFLENGDCAGIVGSNGQNWLEQRRFSLHTLRNLGFGKKSMEDIVAEEAEELCDHLAKKEGNPISMRTEFNISVLNVLWRIMSNERLARESSEMQSIVKAIDVIVKTSRTVVFRVIQMVQPLLKLATLLSNASGGPLGGVAKLGAKTIENHESTYQEESLRDFIDYYIREVNDQAADPSPSSFKGKDGRTNLKAGISDFIIAGSETTSTALNWATLYMLLNPDIQSKVQRELDDVTGGSRPPQASDRPHTPFTEAVLYETLRLGRVFPLSVTHYTTSGGTLGNGKHYIPPDTTVFCNLHALMMDPARFPDPEKFDPTRYLTKDGKFQPHPHVLPFGAGKRRCLGESLAKMELYVFFASLLHRFDLKKEAASTVLTDEAHMAMSNSPKTFKVRFVKKV